MLAAEYVEMDVNSHKKLLARAISPILLVGLFVLSTTRNGVSGQLENSKAIDWRLYQSPTVPRPNILMRATLLNFTDVEEPVSEEQWHEFSDSSILTWGGTSKGTMKLQRTPQFQQVVFFGMISPPAQPPSVLQPGFASVFSKTNFDLSFFTGLKVRVQVQGDYSQLKMILFDNFDELKLEGKAPPVTYELVRDLPFNEFNEVDFNFADFVPFINGEPMNIKDSKLEAPLNLTRITGIGFKVIGRPKVAPEGVAAFEMDYVVAYRNTTGWIPTPDPGDKTAATLFDFTKTDTATGWFDNSDATYMDDGKSCSAMDIMEPTGKNENRRAVFFGLLNPREDKSGFAGIRSDASWDLNGYSKLRVRMRAKGAFDHFKLMLFDDRKTTSWMSGFTSFFQLEENKWIEQDFPLAEFRQFLTNNQAVDKLTLNAKDIRGISFVMFGGKDCAYAGQKGPTTLEIEWIKALKK